MTRPVKKRSGLEGKLGSVVDPIKFYTKEFEHFKVDS